jgi:EmrB/QacA subfamily drug resistance transporter
VTVRQSQRAVPLILAVALFMEQMDSTVIATALPAIAADIGTSPIALKLALTAYLVALAIFIPVSGWAADRFGAKRTFVIAIAVFMASSLLCSLAHSLEFFVVARFLQGMGGAMMTPVARLVLVRATPRSELVSAMAWITMPALAGPLIGPPLGGFITTYASWEWIFLINLPIGLAGIAATLRYLPELPAFEPPPLDRSGFLLVALGAAGIIFGMSVISLPALPWQVGAAAVVAGLAGCVGYVLHARRHPQPILSLSLLDYPTLRACVTGGSLFRIGIGAIPFLLPLMLQLVYGLTPFESGMVTFASAVGAMSMKPVAPPVFRRFGFRGALVWAAILSALSVLAMIAIPPQGATYWLFIAALLAGGFTRSLFFTGINALAFAEVSDQEAAQATALTAVAQQTSIAMGVAVAGGVLETALYFHGGDLGLFAFAAAFGVVALMMALGILPILGLDRDAGKGLAGEAGGQRTRGDLGAELSGPHSP